MDIPEEVVIVPMDPILIRQVIVNIMENAVIHGGSTTQVKVTISANETEAIFSIEDNGKGIDGKILPMLFTGQISHRKVRRTIINGVWESDFRYVKVL